MPHLNTDPNVSAYLDGGAAPDIDEGSSRLQAALLVGGGVLAGAAALTLLHGGMPESALGAQADVSHPAAPPAKEAGLLTAAPEISYPLQWRLPSSGEGPAFTSRVTHGPIIGLSKAAAPEGTDTPTDPDVPAGSDTAPDTGSGVLPEDGVATSGWDSDGLGKHKLYENLEAEGMNAARLTVPVGEPPQQERAIIKGIRPQIKSAIAHHVTMSLLLQQSKDATPRDYSQEAAELAAKFPHVEYFVLGDEWDSPDFFKHYKDVKEIMRAQYLANKAIHELRPGVITRGIGIASGYNPQRFIRRATHIADDEYGGWQNVCDWLDEHFYRSLPEDEHLVEYLRRYYQGPAYYGEVGWIVGPPSSHPGAVSPAEQASNEVSFIDYLAQDSRNMGIGWYLYRNSGNPEDPYKTANVTAAGRFLPSYFYLRSTLKDLG